MSARGLGVRRHRVVLERRVDLTGAGGRRLEKYEPIASAWAETETSHHSPVVRGDKLEYPSTVRFAVHYARRFLEARRIIMNDRTFEVLSVNDPGALSQVLEFRTREIFV